MLMYVRIITLQKSWLAHSCTRTRVGQERRIKVKIKQVNGNRIIIRLLCYVSGKGRGCGDQRRLHWCFFQHLWSPSSPWVPSACGALMILFHLTQLHLPIFSYLYELNTVLFYCDCLSLPVNGLRYQAWQMNKFSRCMINRKWWLSSW